jgi:Na+-transporting NADH:ubiquinone oxidoreductase subunit NqrC
LQLKNISVSLYRSILAVVVIPPELVILQPIQKTEEQYNTNTKIFLRAVLSNFIP